MGATPHFFAGMKAFELGKSLASCPYNLFRPEGKDWEDGWRFAQRNATSSSEKTFVLTKPEVGTDEMRAFVLLFRHCAGVGIGKIERKAVESSVLWANSLTMSQNDKEHLLRVLHEAIRILRTESTAPPKTNKITAQEALVLANKHKQENRIKPVVEELYSDIRKASQNGLRNYATPMASSCVEGVRTQLQKDGFRVITQDTPDNDCYFLEISW